MHTGVLLPIHVLKKVCVEQAVFDFGALQDLDLFLFCQTQIAHKDLIVLAPWSVTLLAAALVAKQMRTTIAAHLVPRIEKLLQKIRIATLVVLTRVRHEVEVAALAYLVLHLMAADGGGGSLLALRSELSALSELLRRRVDVVVHLR